MQVAPGTAGALLQTVLVDVLRDDFHVFVTAFFDSADAIVGHGIRAGVDTVIVGICGQFD